MKPGSKGSGGLGQETAVWPQTIVWLLAAAPGSRSLAAWRGGGEREPVAMDWMGKSSGLEKQDLSPVKLMLDLKSPLVVCRGK